MFTVISLIIGVKIFNELRGTDIFLDNPTATSIRNNADTLNSSWDGIFAFLMVIAFLSPIVAAFLIGQSPAFIWATLLLSIFVILLGVIMNNVYDGIINADDFSDVKDLLPITTYIFDHFGLVLTGFICMLMLALFFGARSGE